MLTKQKFYTKEDLLASSIGKLFNKNSPRLPAPNMLMIDRVIKMDQTGGNYNKGFIVAELDVFSNMWFFNCHFVEDPVMPGCLGLDAMWQLVGFYLGWIGREGKGRALGVREVKFSGQVLPTSKQITYFIHFRKIINKKLTIGLADGEVLCDGKKIYTAIDLKVGLFKHTNFSN